jgi:UDP-GlcNAc:undecaprenyl-phosphate GlcNAc-1-phosphate transferase
MNARPYLLLAVSFGLTAAFTPLARAVATRQGFVAEPNHDRWHRRPTALLGGPAIVAATLLTAVALVGSPHSPLWLSVAVGAVAMAVVGLVDDLIRIRPATKLIAQIALALLPVYYGLGIPQLHPVASVVLSMAWIVGITNAINLLDNMDGLAAGVAAVAAGVLALHALRWGNAPLAAASLCLVGACSGFLLYNFTPASVFMGDCGSLFLGYALGALSLVGLEARPAATLATLAVPVFVLLVPIFDTTLVTVLRLLAGRRISQGGRDHTSHRLVSLGISERTAVLVLWAFAALAGAASLALDSLPGTVLILLSLIATLVVYYFGAYLGSLPVYQIGPAAISAARRRGFFLLDAFVAHKARVVEVIVDVALICGSYLAATLLRWGGTLTSSRTELLTRVLPIVIALRLVSFFATGVYRSVPGAFALADLLAIVRGVAISSLLFIAFLVFTGGIAEHTLAVITLDAILITAAVAFARLATRSIAEVLDPFRGPGGRRVVILGAGNLGDAVLRLLKNDRHAHWRVIGFLDDSPDKIGRRLNGSPVLGSLAMLPRVLDANPADEVIVAIADLDPAVLQEARQICGERGIELREAGIR